MIKKILGFIKSNYIYILVYCTIFIVLTVRLPYYIDAPGGLINVGERIKIEGGFESEGSLNLAYVTEYEATIPMLLLSLFLDDWDVYPKKNAEIPDSYEDMLLRDRLWMMASYSNAIILAYEKAEKEIQIVDEELFVLYVANDANTDLVIGDELLSIDGLEIHSRKDLVETIANKEVGNKVSIKVRHGHKEYERTAEVLLVENTKIIGIVPYPIREYKANPSIEVFFGDSESGPSGGLMTTLAVYNSLIEEDITKGLTIVGTGTIDEEGNVGEIGGVAYKLKGAENKKADIFFVPAGENYEEAMALKEKKKYSIKVVPISTFDEALAYLKDNI